jgi:hypothetical protein
MKLVSEFRRVCVGALVAALMLAPLFATANGHEQPQPQPSEQKAQDFTKTIKKEFPVTATGTVNLINKYGKVDVKTWDKNRVKIDVKIVVNANSESAAQDVFDRIRIDFSNDDSFVKAETVINSSKSSWFDWNWGNDRTEFQINYEVLMPPGAVLDLSNKYGDANVAPLTNKATIDVKYGNFRLEGVGGNLTVKLGYGNGTVVKAGDASADVSYAKINFNEAQDVNFVSKYSKITIDKGADVKAESRYDQFYLPKVRKFHCQSSYGNVEIGSAESIIAVSRYTDYKVDRLSDNCDFDLQYGGLNVQNLAKGFSNVSLVGRYSDFKINVEGGASYTLDAAANYAGIAYPANFNVSYEKDKGTSHEVKGHSGTQGARSVIKANLSYGGLKVKQ